MARPFLGDSPFIMYLGDNLIENQLDPFLEIFNKQKLDALILLRPVPNPSAFGVAKVDEKGRVLELVEKPQVPPSNLALVGIYFFAPTIHEAIDQIQPSARGETGNYRRYSTAYESGKTGRSLQFRGLVAGYGEKRRFAECKPNHFR
ncbi:sugar phosphate nucleotidyltransferase [Microcoleus vaginatus]|uniref:sugar phosphate nucleotidyltransferase n=1 Tax=Microcoleus vaginatus TaxID=119532 RepID=UPI00403F4BDB